MSANQDLGPRIRGWLHERLAERPDPYPILDEVLSQLPTTPQRRHRWWPFGRGTTKSQPSPIPAIDERSPIVTRRTQTMFSPVKAITAGALVFALGGLFLIAQPLDQQRGVPGAEQGAEPAPPVKVTITATRGSGEDIDGGCTSDTPEVCTSTWAPAQWSATDPRLSGTATIRAAEKWWPNGGDYRLYPVFEAYAIELVNDQGRWVGTGRGTGPLDGLIWFTLTGEGEYEGHSAVVTVDHSDSDDDGISTNLAVIVEGELPPFPELPSE